MVHVERELGGSTAKNYELVLVFSPAAAEERVSGVLERVQRLIADRAGAVVKQEQWGMRRLAYPIRHMQEGNYVYTQFQAEPGVGREIENTLRVTDDVLRHLLVEMEAPAPRRRPLRRRAAASRAQR